MNRKPQISIILPVKQEQDNIKWLVEAISLYVRPRYELLVIYDDPQDPTVGRIRKLRPGKRVVLVKNLYGKGVLNAI